MRDAVDPSCLRSRLRW